MARSLLLVSCLFLLAPAARAAEPPPPAREVLPAAVDPVSYELSLVPDAQALLFQGRVRIVVEVHEPVREVFLNAAGLTIEGASADGDRPAQITVDTPLQRIGLRFAEALAAGRHEIAIAYHGTIGRTTQGFFAMDYEAGGEKARTLATNFEPSNARNLLPCWDEPGRKATFNLTVEAPLDRMAVSNMPVAEVTPVSATRQKVRFATTPRMSTYLLFLAIGDFERIHKVVDGVDVGVITQRGATARGAYALEEAGSLLHFYNDYFGVAYPLPKLDLVAAPGDIWGGAMENWGAILYSQGTLLIDPAGATESDRQLVFEVVAHEMAHQWFGDLVTMAWWDDLWLNEGFASWMQTTAADALHPDWKTGVRALRTFERGRRDDALPSTHPVVQPVYTAAQAEEAFDAITYNKGAAVITMLAAHVGEGPFREGIRHYMREHAFGNTVDADLWGAVEKAAGRPILAIERDFTRQVGVPVVFAVRTPHGVHLSQGRFADDPRTLAGAPPFHWRTPLEIATPGGAVRSIVLEDPVDVELDLPILVNAGQNGYVRVLYDNPLMAALTGRFASLAPRDQLGLLNDAYALGTAEGVASMDNLLQLLDAVPVAGSPDVWLRVCAILEDLDARYGALPGRAAFREHYRAPLARVVQRLSSTDAGPSGAILLETATRLLGRLGDPSTLAWARRVQQGEESAPLPRQQVALEIVAIHADAATFDALFAKSQATKDLLERQRILRALAGVADPALARRMLEFAIGADAPAGMTAVLVVTVAWGHPDLAWKVVAPRAAAGGLPMETGERNQLAGVIASQSADPARIAELEDYVSRNVPADARRPFEGYKAMIRRNMRFRSSVLPQVDQWVAAPRVPSMRAT